MEEAGRKELVTPHHIQRKGTVHSTHHSLTLTKKPAIAQNER
jgi:hypothetical protein